MRVISSTSRRLALIASVAVLTQASVAEAKWSHTTTFRYSRSTSIRVVEPQGFTAQVNERKDTVPAVFNLPGQNAYVWVTITASDGQVWRQKIEVRSRNETVLTVRYEPEEKPSPSKGPGRKYIGNVANTTHRCKRSDRGAYRFDFMLGGQKVYSVALRPNKYVPNVELTEGSYDVRVFKRQRGNYIYKTTIQQNIKRDGWRVSYGCGK
jgi:hypothetical protein